MDLIKGWFTEIHSHAGTAFSLKTRQVLHEEKTPYQHLAIHDTETFGPLMVLDGCTMVSGRDNFIYHEMLSHPALFAHPDPKRVLIIGGGDCGTLREVLKHPGVARAEQVEIDERVTRVAEQYFPELCSSNGDPRARLHFTDGVAFMNEGEAGRYDVIIVDSTDPVGPAEGLFTADFYRNCWRALADPGILVLQSESPLLHMDILTRVHGALREADFSDSRTLFFPQCIYPSGWWSATLGGKGLNPARFRVADAQNRPFRTQYYNAAVHQAALAMPEFFRQAFEIPAPITKEGERRLGCASVSPVANVFFDGKVVSHSLHHPDGTRQTAGIVYPGEFRFDVGGAEHMEITSGRCRVKLAGDSEWCEFDGRGEFSVPANSHFLIAVDAGVAQYICTFL
jgi:spermidine synthase